jgi:hypothetical protein
MWEYFWPDLAFDVVKGLVAGSASLALQAVAPGAVRAWKRFRARRLGKPQEKQATKRANDERSL